MTPETIPYWTPTPHHQSDQGFVWINSGSIRLVGSSDHSPKLHLFRCLV